MRQKSNIKKFKRMEEGRMVTPNNGDKKAQAMQTISQTVLALFNSLPPGQAVRLRVPKSAVIVPGKPRAYEYLYIQRCTGEITIEGQL